MDSISETAERANKGKGKDQGKWRGKNYDRGDGKTGDKGSTRTPNDEAKSEYAIYTSQEKNWARRNRKKNGGGMMGRYFAMGMVYICIQVCLKKSEARAKR